MVRRDAVLAEALGEQVREPLGQPARVHEDQRGAVLRDVLRDPVEDLAPLLVRGDGLELALRQLDGEVERRGGARGRRSRSRARRRRASAPAPRPTSRRAIVSIGRCVAERPMRCGRRSQSASSRSSVSARCAPRLSRASAWISSTITVRTRRKRSRLLLGGEQQVERLGRGDEDVRRALEHARRRAEAACRRCATARGSRARAAPARARRSRDLRQRRLEVLLDVDGERLERRDVDDLGRVLAERAALRALAQQAVDAERKAASVLPEPVGAAISVSSPPAIAGQPCACGSVGPSGKRRSNQARTAG